MAARRLCIALSFFLLFVSMEIHTVLAQGNNNGNGNEGNNNGNGNGGNGNGNDNKGNNNGNGNAGDGNGNGNKGDGNGNGNGTPGNGSGNGIGNVGNNNGNGNKGNGNGNGNVGNNNGNGNKGNGNGNGNKGDGNGNGNGTPGNGSGNGIGNVGNNNGNGNKGNGNGNGNVGNNNGNGNGNGNVGNNNGNGNVGNNNGNGNKGNGNGNGNVGNNNGNGNEGNGNGNGNRGSNNGNGNGKKPPYDAATTNYDVLPKLPQTGQERAFCKGRGACHFRTLTCPAQCPERKPKKNKKQKGCFIDCSSKCEVTCKWRKPKCNGFGSLCYDPRFVGGDGVMFYFHGAKGRDFAIVSDENLHINAHFIGTRPVGRTRDFTWVQALSIMFDSHTLVIAAKRIPHWDDNVDALIVKWDGETIDIPTDGEAERKLHSRTRVTTIERTDDLNTIRVTVDGLVEIDIRVTPIGEQENKIHNYQIPKDDSFAHLETQFRFFNLSDFVEGILGKTYRPGYISPVKKGVPMPMMGGEDKYQTPSLYSFSCKVCRFQRPSAVAKI